MEEKWSVISVNRQEEWKNLNQIQGNQTLLRNNLFGMTLRIVPTDDGKYKIIDFGVSPINIYNRLMEESGINTDLVYEDIERELLSGEWTETNVIGLMDYGVVEGISTRLQLKDNENHFETHARENFLSNNYIETMRQLEWDEYFNYQSSTDEEKLELLKESMDKKENPKFSTKLMYNKYKGIVEEKKKSKEYGARAILDFMKKNNLTYQDLSLAFVMAKAKKTGVIEAESCIVDEKTSQFTSDREEPTQIG